MRRTARLLSSDPTPKPSTPALLETTVSPETLLAASAASNVSGMPHRPKPPTSSVLPSRTPARASAADEHTLPEEAKRSARAQADGRGRRRMLDRRSISRWRAARRDQAQSSRECVQRRTRNGGGGGGGGRVQEESHCQQCPSSEPLVPPLQWALVSRPSRDTSPLKVSLFASAARPPAARAFAAAPERAAPAPSVGASVATDGRRRISLRQRRAARTGPRRVRRSPPPPPPPPPPMSGHKKVGMLAALTKAALKLTDMAGRAKKVVEVSFRPQPPSAAVPTGARRPRRPAAVRASLPPPRLVARAPGCSLRLPIRCLRRPPATARPRRPSRAAPASASSGEAPPRRVRHDGVGHGEVDVDHGREGGLRTRQGAQGDARRLDGGRVWRQPLRQGHQEE